MGIENIPFESFEDISLENRHGYSMVQFDNGQLKGESNWKNGKKKTDPGLVGIKTGKYIENQIGWKEI